MTSCRSFPVPHSSVSAIPVGLMYLARNRERAAEKEGVGGGEEEEEALSPPCPSTASCLPAVDMNQVHTPTRHGESSRDVKTRSLHHHRHESNTPSPGRPRL